MGGCQVVFIHKAGFIGGVRAETLEEAVEAAEDWVARSTQD